MGKHTKYLIIGNSAAGIGAVEGIRIADPLGQILVISDEDYHTYSRPLISYWLEGKVADENIYYRDPDYYSSQDVQVKLGDKVLELNPSDKSVTLDTGEEIRFDKCLLATGSHPFVPPIKGKDTAKNATTFTKMEDALKADEIIKECELEGRKPKVIILGAGLIGLKACEAIYDQADEITILDLADRVMPSVFNKNASEVMEEFIKSKGINLLLQTSIDEILDKQVRLTNGETLDYDLLFLAVGTRPAVELAEGAGIETDRGIVVDPYQQTSEANIYAAGDCTLSFDISSQSVKNIAILPNAYIQGKYAGLNMAGQDVQTEELFPLNSMGFLGLHLITAGCYDGESIIVDDDGVYKEFFVKDNKLIGYIIIGTCERSGIYTHLIRKQTDLSEVDFDSLILEPTLSSFGKQDRFNKLSRPH